MSSSMRALPKSDTETLKMVDKGVAYANTGLGFITSLSTLLLNPKFGTSALAIASALYANDYATAWNILQESGLLEQSFDSAVHFYNGTLSNNSSKLELLIGVALDLTRACVAINKEANHTNTIPSFLNIPDGIILHPINLGINISRFANQWFSFHRPASTNNASQQPSHEAKSTIGMGLSRSKQE